MSAGVLMRSPLGVEDPVATGSGQASSSSSSSRAEVKFQRGRAADFRDLSAPFLLPAAAAGQRDFQRQFFHVYSRRLESMRAPLEAEARRRGLRVAALSEMPEVEAGAEVVLVGTVFKAQPLKPSILRELAEEQGVAPQPVSAANAAAYTSERDELILEDNLQRIRLRGDPGVLRVGALVTGVVAAFRGAQRESGKFHVEEVLLAPPKPQPERPRFQQDRFVVFLSGLDLFSDSSDALGPLQLAVDWLCGEAGEMDEQERNARIERVVVAGNGLGDDVSRRGRLLKSHVSLSRGDGASLSSSSSLRLADVWSKSPEWGQFVSFLEAADAEGTDSDGSKLSFKRYATFMELFREFADTYPGKPKDEVRSLTLALGKHEEDFFGQDRGLKCFDDELKKQVAKDLELVEKGAKPGGLWLFETACSRVLHKLNYLIESYNEFAKRSGTSRHLTKDKGQECVEGVKLLDEYLAQLASSVDVDVMPGEHDPANQLMPQQPLHPCLFPEASVFPTLRTVSNPYSFSVDGLVACGTSGQNTDDVLRNWSADGGGDDPLDALDALLDWSHLAPTCPDTLGCFPYRDADPFILEQTPHVFFTANQRRFSHRLRKDSSGSEVLLLSIPRFSVTNSLVMLNLRTLTAEEVVFNFDFTRNI